MWEERGVRGGKRGERREGTYLNEFLKDFFEQCGCTMLPIPKIKLKS